jgi:hypothetical protein
MSLPTLRCAAVSAHDGAVPFRAAVADRQPQSTPHRHTTEALRMLHKVVG